MNEGFEYLGEWWLPEHSSNKVVGILNFSPNEGAELKLIGSFDKNKLLEPEIILGKATSGEKITLVTCIQTKNLGGKICIFDIDTIFIDVHFRTIEKIKFKSLSIHYSHLDEWVDFNPLKQSEGGGGETIIEHKKPKTISTDFDDGTKISISSEGRIASSSDKNKGICIKSETLITIQPPKEKPFQEFKKIIRTIQNLLTLAVGEESVYPLTVKGRTKVNKVKIEGITLYPSVEIISKISDFKKPISLMKHRMLFTFSEISDKFDAFLQNWFDTSHRLKPVCDLYFGTRYNPRLYIENQFLSYMIAIEAFHRIDVGGEYLSRNDYENICDILINSIPNTVKKNHKESLKSKIKYGYEFSMRKRLRDVCIIYKKNIDKFITDVKLFNNCVVDTRNYLIHNDPISKGEVCTGKKLVVLTYQLKLFLEIVLLRKLGFNEKEINNLLSKHERFKKEFIERSLVLQSI